MIKKHSIELVELSYFLSQCRQNIGYNLKNTNRSFSREVENEYFLQKLQQKLKSFTSNYEVWVTGHFQNVLCL